MLDRCILIAFLVATSSLEKDKILHLSVLEPKTVYLGSATTFKVYPIYENWEGGSPKIANVNISLSNPGDMKLCLSVVEGFNKSPCRNSVSAIFNRSSPVTFEIEYISVKDESVIKNERPLELKGISDNEIPVVIQSAEITVKDARKLMLGFSGEDSYRTFASDTEVRVQQWNTSQKISRPLAFNMSLFELHDQDAKLLGIKTLGHSDGNTSWQVALSSFVAPLDSTKSYLVYLSTNLTEVAFNQSELWVYPFEQETKCQKLAAEARGLVDEVTVNQLHKILMEMCKIVVEEHSYVTTSTAADAPTIATTTPSSAATTTASSVTSVASTAMSSASEMTTSGSIESGNGLTPDTTETTGEDSVQTTTTEDSVQTTTTEDSVQTTTMEDISSEESTDATTSLDENESAASYTVWYYGLFVFVIVLVLGVMVYLLINHHAKVKVYLFQLVGKGGSTASAMTSRHSRSSSSAKYSPLPTNVRETMLHQD